MRITDRYQNLMDRVAPGAAKSTDKTDKSESSGAAKTAKSVGGALEVKVSGRAQELAAGTARLDELRNAIKDGSFKVDSQAIARNLVGLLGDE